MSFRTMKAAIAATAAAMLAGRPISEAIYDHDGDSQRSFGGRASHKHTRRRGKGVQAKPKKRPNMHLVSKRVRRKHRRAS